MQIQMIRRHLICVLAAFLSTALAGPDGLTWRVGPAGGTGDAKAIRAALAASRKHSGRPRRILLAPGRYYIEEPIMLDAQDEGLRIEGAGAGKTIVYGGRRITKWRRDGDRFWVANLPEVKTGKWDFRALVVNDRLCPRARLPEKGYFEHESRFPVRWMSTAGGGWERKPTKRELTTLKYRKGDLGAWLNAHNAEVTVYHMWDESMVRVAAIDPQARTLTFSSPCGHPPGAFGVHKYVVWNVREGMTQPGQWYLDRGAGKVVYWPLAGEDMGKALAVAPRVEIIFDLHGQTRKPVRNITLRAMTLSATTTPCKAGGFGASRYRGAVNVAWGQSIHVADVEITNTAGHAVRDWGTRELLVENCHLHHLGAAGLRLGGGTGRIENNRIHHVGLIYPSAIGLSAGGHDSRYVIRRNEIHDTPYSGMAVGGTGAIIEENLIYRCMRELHDGAAIYVSGAKGAVIRRNVARDITKVGKGYGAEAYYLDEKCRDCVVEKNVAIRVPCPSLHHMTLNCVLRDNVFISDGDMRISFSRSAGQRVTGNIFQLDGKFKIGDPDAVTEWSDNLIVQPAGISDAMPRPPHKTREKPRYARAVFLSRPPVIDGRLGGKEWPSGGVSIRERPDQRLARGAPLVAKFGADAAHLYVAVTAVSMFPEERKLGHVWGQDEGVEIAVEGKRPGGERVPLVLRGFADGSFRSITDGGASPSEAKTLADGVRFAAVVEKKLWRCEWSISFAALRFTPRDRAVLPLNVTVYRSENGTFVQWAGTLGETWDMKRGGRLILRF